MVEERTSIGRVILIGLTEIAIIAVSAAFGLLVAHAPQWMHHFGVGR